MTTVRDLITASLKRIQVLGAGENLTAEDAADGLVMLNQLLSSWAADGMIIYDKSLDSIPLTGGVQSYTMGPGGDIDTVRPVMITQASVNLGIIQYWLNIHSQNVESTLSFPNITAAIPSDLYVNNTVPTVELFLYPVPSGGLTLNIYSLKPLSDLTLNQTIALPPGYERALRDNLAVEWAPDFEREAQPTVKDSAYDSLQAIKRNNEQYAAITMKTDGILLVNNATNTNWFNIYGGF